MKERKPVNFLLLLVASLLIYASCGVVAGTLSTTDHWKGFVHSLQISSWWLPGIPWLVFVLPLNLLVLGLYRWRKWRRGRTLLTLAPSLWCYSGVVLMLIAQSGTRGFENDVGFPLPSSAQDFRSYFGNSVDGDALDFYYFRCAPKDTENLIKTLQSRFSGMTGQSIPGIPMSDWPDPITWSGKRVFLGNDSTNPFHECTLITDGKEEQVFILMDFH